jgi:hypothetical protein
MVKVEYLTGWFLFFFFLFNVDGLFQFLTGVYVFTIGEYVFIILRPPALPRSERHCSPEEGEVQEQSKD